MKKFKINKIIQEEIQFCMDGYLESIDGIARSYFKRRLKETICEEVNKFIENENNKRQLSGCIKPSLYKRLCDSD